MTVPPTDFPFSLTFEHRLPTAPSDNPPLLLMLHGYGSNERDLMGLAPFIDGRLLVVSARAPYSLDTQSHVWFHLSFDEKGVSWDPEEADTARIQLAKFLEEIVTQFDVDRRRILVGGFSQGAIMSVGLLLTEPDSMTGVLALSGAFPSLDPSTFQSERIIGKPVFISHGVSDRTLPVAGARLLRDNLQALRADVEYHEYDMGHEIQQQTLVDLVNWISKHL